MEPMQKEPGVKQGTNMPAAVPMPENAAMGAPVSQVMPAPGMPDFELIEALFFAYRDFVGEPDRLLARHGFGRAHHRVLHFVNRRPGLTVAELLDILDITKQSLARVLKDLLKDGFLEQRPGAEDRRQRLLYLSVRGRELANGLASMQGRRMERALAKANPALRAAILAFLTGLIDGGTPNGNPAVIAGKP